MKQILGFEKFQDALLFVCFIVWICLDMFGYEIFGLCISNQGSGMLANS